MKKFHTLAIGVALSAFAAHAAKGTATGSLVNIEKDAFSIAGCAEADALFLEVKNSSGGTAAKYWVPSTSSKEILPMALTAIATGKGIIVDWDNSSTCGGAAPGGKVTKFRFNP